MSNPPVNLTGQDYSVLFQAYCLNPPADSCDFGACPNSDVSGIGQLISLGMLGVTYSTVFFFAPEKLHLPSYAYLVNIYSLLAAAMVSLLEKKQLTQSDAVFVLLAVGSPSSIYLWTFSGYVFLRRIIRSPVQHVSYGIETQVQLDLLAVLSAGSFLLYCVMVVMVAVPSFSSYFNQPGCNEDGRAQLWDMLWPFGLLIQLAIIAIGLAFISDSVRGCIWRTRQPPPFLKRLISSVMPNQRDFQMSYRRTSQNIILWSRSSLKRCFPIFGTPGMISALILLIQTSGILSLALRAVPFGSAGPWDDLGPWFALPSTMILYWSASHWKEPKASRRRHIVTTSIFGASLAIMIFLGSGTAHFLRSPLVQYLWWFGTWASIYQSPSTLVLETSFHRFSRVEILFAVYRDLMEGIRPAYVLTFISFVVIPNVLWIWVTLDSSLKSPGSKYTWSFGQVWNHLRVRTDISRIFQIIVGLAFRVLEGHSAYLHGVFHADCSPYLCTL